MKRLFSFLMAVVLVLSLGATAFAAEDNGSITITNATVDQTYTVYKIFDASVKLVNGEAEAISYTIKPDNQFYSYLFGADGKTENNYFIYESSTGTVTKRAAVNDSELVTYLSNMVQTGSYTPAAEPKTAESNEVKFENLPYGYYMILSTLGATVTINSTTPEVEVIDKNQKPAPDFKKEVLISEGNWGSENSASIGDKVTYRISYTATNYDGANKIQYYQIHDIKGDAIWADFESLRVWVGGVELTRGYYLCHGNANELNPDGAMEYLGEWGDVEKNANNAQWYLVHLSLDEFRITIPWLENHTLTASGGAHSLAFEADAASKYASPAQVVITYDAAIEATALIGNGANTNLFNRANVSWTSAHETRTSQDSRVVTATYGIGLLKDEENTGINLAGAEFRIYSDASCTLPVNVIPTNIKGVYMVDSLGSDIENVHGNSKTARSEYEAYLEGYLGAEYATKQDNLVVSQVNGKLVIKGLEVGTYYLKEVKAPDGYNALSKAVEIIVGTDTRAFQIFADASGNVADLQHSDDVYGENTYYVTSTVVHNSKGVELPATGGQGTMLLITLGSIVATAFAVLLITNKKMSTYKD